MTNLELELAHTSGFYKKRGITLVKGEGAILWDENGRELIDCIGGLGVCTLGHGNEAVADAIAHQARTLMSCPESFTSPLRAQFQAALVELLPEGMDRVFLCNSGAEANEAALKLARLATKRTGFVSTLRGFHGRTYGALSATPETKYREPFAPWVPGFTHVLFNKIEAMEKAVTEETAAVIIEPVQGEGGVYPPDPGYLAAVRKITEEKGALLIMDEVQSGFGRMGSWFGCQKYGIVPDILTMAKAIAGGVPMGATAFGPKVTGLHPGLHGTTFGGNPLACAAGLASIAELKRIDAPRLCAEKGEYLMNKLKALDSPLIREVRGEGLWIGVELKVKVAPLLEWLQNNGLLCPPAGLTVLRFLPPAVISYEQMDKAVEILAQGLAVLAAPAEPEAAAAGAQV
jgi:LysW-gamma-L-lysine/LysW-L-ornithine aminotransferase